jgi:predicted Zn-dependent peptidase
MISKGPKALSQKFKKDETLHIHDIIAEWERMRDPYLFSIWGTTNSPTKSALSQAEKCIEDIVAMFHDPCNMKGLMESSKRNIKNGWDNELLGTRNTAMAINEAIARGDAFDVYRRYELLEQVDLSKITKVSKKYFDFRQSTVGWLWPGEVPHEIKPSNYEPLKTLPFVKLPETNTSKFEASNDVFTQYENGKADVRISLQGSEPSVQNYISNYLLSELMTRGFKISDKVCSEEKLYDYLQNKNIQRVMSASVDSLHVQASIPIDTLGTASNLLLKELQNPILERKTYEYLKKKWCSELYGAKNNVNHVAKVALNQVLFQRSDPNYRYSFDEIVNELNRMEYETMKTAHTKLLTGPRLVTVVSPTDCKLPNQGEWKREAVNKLMVQGKSNDIKIDGKSSVVLRYGMVVEYSDALKMAVAVLGNGFTGRLMRIVRDECGYTYGINASLVHMKGCAVFQITGTFSPAFLEKGTQKTEEVVHAWLESDLTEEEVRVQKSETIGSQNVQFDTPGALASAIHHTKLMYGSVDRINSYKTLINNITLDQINAAKGLISFDKLSRVRVGTF